MSNSVWQVILGLSRYSVFEPQNRKKLGDCPRVSLLSGFRVFGVFRGSLLFGDKSEQHGDGAKGKRVISSSAA